MGRYNARTRKDDLRIGTPIWVKTPHSTVEANHALPNGAFDVVVVGAGVSGALVSEALTRAGHRVLIVDRRPPARGSTAASTAMIQHEIDVPLVHLRRKIGVQKADRAWLRSVKAVKDLTDLVQDLEIDCQFAPKPALYLCGNQMGHRAMTAEAAARNKIGIKAEYLSGRALKDRFNISRTGAILSQDSASANPAQLTAGLLEVAIARGASLVSPLEVTDISEMSGVVSIATGDGRSISARDIVFCTGYEHLVQMRSKAHRVTSTWALASYPTTPLPRWMEDTIVWEASDPYLYFRTDAHGRVIVGGEDEDAAHANESERKLKRKSHLIQEKLATLTGVTLQDPDYAWAAPFSATVDGLPIIDRVPGFKNAYSLMGFGGNGITFSMIGAQIISAAIAGDQDPDSDIFRYR
ncbi:NAD(P)/FAD-dependent oxidoreductase [Ketogulonicigenium vulgare]|uniref:NAD(P)/FAD-dependent oxidoreductase n=1 Tax=Ketogulonicigenium vulgare TaxID=92945 RepID=UPI002359B82D|nr:FAD-dependent oxidoreductase [Ketogulonicigenium vulgare]